MPRTYKKYDHRLKQMVVQSGDIEKFQRIGIPKSTLRQWLKRGVCEVVSLPELNMSNQDLVQENLELRRQLEEISTKQELVLSTTRIFGFEIQFKRLPSGSAKEMVLSAIKKATSVVPLSECLSTIGLSIQRYRHWLRRAVHCELQDHSSCPVVSPTKLTISEVKTIGELYTSPSFRHLSVSSLCLLAKRTGTVVASLSTWCRVIREQGFKRCFKRIYPPKPKVGVRARFPGQIWHLDMTVLRLEDGTRSFLQCIIDNFSRYVLAWSVDREYGGVKTRELLRQALTKASELGLQLIPNVFVDSGSENINKQVDEMIEGGLIQRTIAQIEVHFSNSMIEALFLRLKHRYLYTIALTNFEALVRGVSYYIIQSNEYIPLAALHGATPLEAITGKWSELQIEEMKSVAKGEVAKRKIENQSKRCSHCVA